MAPAHILRALKRRGCCLLAMLMLAALASGCATNFDDVARLPSRTIEHGAKTTLGRAFAGEAARHPGRSGFRWLPSGQASLHMRLALADLAQSSIDLQYYSVGNRDRSTEALLLRIRAAALRGVRVRILLDDIDASARGFGRRALEFGPHVEVRIYNPFSTSTLGSRALEFLFDGARLNRRMHNKLWIVDNSAAIVGSRNLGDEYFDAKPSANFTDIEVFVAGPLVTTASASFDEYWNSSQSIPLDFLLGPAHTRAVSQPGTREQHGPAPCAPVTSCDPLPVQSLARQLVSGALGLTWAAATFEADHPAAPKLGPPSGIDHGEPGDRDWGERTERELILVSPYFVPGEHGLRHLGQMRGRGVRVAVLTNSAASTDSLAAHAGYSRYRIALLQQGIELYELRPEPGRQHERAHRWGDVSPDSLHSKVVIQDRRRVIIGSVNQDPRSRIHNREAWLMIDSVELAAELARMFDEAIDPHHAYVLDLLDGDHGPVLSWATDEGGSIIRYTTEPRAGGLRRLLRALMGALVPEHLL